MFKRIKRFFTKSNKLSGGSTICFKNMQNSTNGLSIESYFSHGNATEVKR